MKQFRAFIHNDFCHIFRDTRTTMILTVMPIVLIVLFGYAITTEIQRVPLAIVDHSRNELTLKITERLKASEYFELYKMADNHQEIESLFRRNQIFLAVIFPPQYGSNPDAQVQILSDATDPNQATQLTAFASNIIAQQLGIAEGGGIHPIPYLLYNPAMKGSYNFVLGVMGLILILICAMITSVGIVREKETGTMELLLVSPLKPIYIILAKAIPYLLISLVNITTILTMSYFLLDVPIRGSLFVLVGISVLYAVVSLCLGLLISTIADTQQAAMLISSIVLLLPVILLSGMVFPIENLPGILQGISHIVPARWYIIAVRDVMIKGLPLTSVLSEVGILISMALGLILLSVKRFRVRL